MLTFTPLTWADAGPLYVWRHDPETVKWSIKPPPTWEEHLRWVNEEVSHDRCTTYVGYLWSILDKYGSPAVCVSADRGEVNITTNPCLRRRGYASEALRFIQGFRQSLRATIISGNDASFHLFTKCGFKPQIDQKDSIVIMEWTP